MVVLYTLAGFQYDVHLWTADAMWYCRLQLGL